MFPTFSTVASKLILKLYSGSTHCTLQGLISGANIANSGVSVVVFTTIAHSHKLREMLLFRFAPVLKNDEALL